MSDYTVALKDICSVWPAMLPPARIRVSESIARTLVIARPGGAVGPWAPDEVPYMIEPCDLVASRDFSAICFVGPAQSGKCLDVRTPIPTTRGMVPMGEISVGDRVFGPDGMPTEVLAAHDVLTGRPCYELTFSDGTTLVADDEHLWGVERFRWAQPNWEPLVTTTAAIASDWRYGRNRFRYRIRQAQPLQMPQADLPVEPYLLGLWLGDGSSGHASLSAHADDAEHYMRRLLDAGHDVEARADRRAVVAIVIDRRDRLSTHCQRGHEYGERGRLRGGGCRQCANLGHWKRKRGVAMPEQTLFANSFQSRLRSLGVLGDKHIPDPYLWASERQRWDLLRGLMDTDGSVKANSCSAEFTSTSHRLMGGFVHLARSLGLKPRVEEKTTSWTYLGARKTGKALRARFPIPAGARVFDLPRKVSACAKAERDVVNYRQIVDVRPVESRPVRCIRVAHPSSLFVAGENFVVTHNTAGLVDGVLAHAIANDPGDALVVQMTQDKAREFSTPRMDRMIRHSPALNGLLVRDNIHDKLFRNGMLVKIAWPTPSNLASTSYRYAISTDYDRVEDDIGGEGDLFGMLQARIRTFMSRGKVIVESSPGRPVHDPNWRPQAPHEAPPVGGVLGIYNRGDRRRWFWKCPHCAEWFEAEPGLGLFGLPHEKQLLEDVRSMDIDRFAQQYARVICPRNGCVVEFEHRKAMNAGGRWLAEGLSIDEHDRVSGDPRTSSIASFWCGGVAATYSTWPKLIRGYLQGLLGYALEGKEQALQTTVNLDQGMPYLSRHLASTVDTASAPIDRALDFPRYIVPDWTRFVLAFVDVQGGRNARFVVQVHAIGPYGEEQLVDRYAITRSARAGAGDEAAPIDPASHAEDWDMLTAKVVLATYRTPLEGREIRVYRTMVDSGGEDGVTYNAYRWFRRLRDAGHAHLVRLSKGDAKMDPKTDWYIRESYVGMRAGTMGDIPLQLLNTNKLKDVVDSCLRKRTPGPGYYHFPKPKHPTKNPDGWLPESFFDELQAEVRLQNGKWSRVRKANEAFDSCVGIKALQMLLGVDRRGFWDDPPAWAAPLASNSEVIDAGQRRAEQTAAASLPPAPRPATLERRVRRSNYLAD